MSLCLSSLDLGVCTLLRRESFYRTSFLMSLKNLMYDRMPKIPQSETMIANEIDMRSPISLLFGVKFSNIVGLE